MCPKNEHLNGYKMLKYDDFRSEAINAFELGISF